ncbi:alpha/beta fold hydrolase [Halodesulfovibrio aestuarii]|uniref:Alpha/beta fold hydrolase n=1 Tax=Halodesulfovibrio aestuarii TaxID=126333 RepID=A0ABV4JTC3_9BACT
MILLCTLLLLFILGCYVFAVVTYLLYWYEHQSRIESLFDSRENALRAVHRGVFSAFKAQIFVFSMYFGGTIVQRWKNRNSLPLAATEYPIIMVHGLFHNCSAWFLYRRWFKKYGLTNCATFTYSSRKAFDVVSAELTSYLETVLEQEPAIRPVLIGHSLGGLLLRDWLARSEYADRVAGVITLGAPMQGSKLATFAATSLGRQLDFKGQVIQQIEKQEQTHAAHNVPCYMFYSPVDNMVLPQNSVATPLKNWLAIKTRPVSHLAMLFDKTIANQIAETTKTIFKK